MTSSWCRSRERRSGSLTDNPNLKGINFKLTHSWCGFRYGDFPNAWKLMQRFWQCNEIKKFENAVISRNHNDKIAKSWSVWISWIICTIPRCYSTNHFLHNWPVCLWDIILFTENHRRITYRATFPIYFPIRHNCVHIMSGLGNTGIIMTPQRRCYAHGPQTMHRFLQSTVCHSHFEIRLQILPL